MGGESRRVGQLQHRQVLQVSVAAGGQKVRLYHITQPREHAATPGGSHDIHRDGGGQALADVLEEVIGGEHVGAPRNQVLLELQQLRASAQEDLRCTQGDTQASLQGGKLTFVLRCCRTLSPKRR